LYLDSESVWVRIQVGFINADDFARWIVALRDYSRERSCPFGNQTEVSPIEQYGSVSRAGGLEEALGLMSLDGDHEPLPQLSDLEHHKD